MDKDYQSQTYYTLRENFTKKSICLNYHKSLNILMLGNKLFFWGSLRMNWLSFKESFFEGCSSYLLHWILFIEYCLISVFHWKYPSILSLFAFSDIYILACRSLILGLFRWSQFHSHRTYLFLFSWSFILSILTIFQGLSGNHCTNNS